MERLLRSAEAQIRRDIMLVLLALVSVGIAAYEVLHPHVSGRLTVLDAIDLAIVLVFIADFVREMRRAPDRGAYLRRHWWEIPALVPITPGMVGGLAGFGLVRGVRLVRLARVIRLLRLIGIASRIRRSARYVSRIARRAQLTKIVAAGAIMVLLGSLAIYLLESAVNPRVATVSGSLWFALNLVTNVAYLDYQPATPGGYAVAAMLEIFGVAFIGVFAGSLASAIIAEPSALAEDE